MSHALQILAELDEQVEHEGRELLRRYAGIAGASGDLAALGWSAAALADAVEIPAHALGTHLQDWVGTIADASSGELVRQAGDDGALRLALSCEPLRAVTARLLTLGEDISPAAAAGAALHELLFDVFVGQLEARLRAA